MHVVMLGNANIFQIIYLILNSAVCPFKPFLKDDGRATNNI